MDEVKNVLEELNELLAIQVDYKLALTILIGHTPIMKTWEDIAVDSDNHSIRLLYRAYIEITNDIQTLLAKEILKTEPRKLVCTAGVS